MLRRMLRSASIALFALSVIACSEPTGGSDAGSHADASTHHDAGAPDDDAGMDAATRDAGTSEDASVADAGGSSDAAIADAGTDAGGEVRVDGGSDAGERIDGGNCACPRSGTCASIDDILCAPAAEYPCSSADGWYAVCTERGWECRFTSPAIC